jgi:hypothetical protein
MNLNDVVSILHCTVRTGGDQLKREVKGGYAGDLLSDVIANSKAGDIWVTMQVHANIVAVAVLKELAGIVLVRGRQPVEDTVRRAAEENVAILVSDLPAFEVVGKLYSMTGGGT